MNTKLGVENTFFAPRAPSSPSRRRPRAAPRPILAQGHAHVSHRTPRSLLASVTNPWCQKAAKNVVRTFATRQFPSHFAHSVRLRPSASSSNPQVFRSTVVSEHSSQRERTHTGQDSALASLPKPVPPTLDRRVVSRRILLVWPSRSTAALSDPPISAASRPLFYTQRVSRRPPFVLARPPPRLQTTPLGPLFSSRPFPSFFSRVPPSQTPAACPRSCDTWSPHRSLPFASLLLLSRRELLRLSPNLCGCTPRRVPPLFACSDAFCAPCPNTELSVHPHVRV